MRQKLKDFRDHRLMSYQHLGNFAEGDKVWYQPLNGNAWLGPAVVLSDMRIRIFTQLTTIELLYNYVNVMNHYQFVYVLITIYISLQCSINSLS